MKTKAIILGIIIFSMLACNKDSISQLEKNSDVRVKRKLFYDYIEDTIPKQILEYKYNKDVLIEKIYYYHWDIPDKPFIYESFEYNTNTEITDHCTYHYANETSGWEIDDSTSYNYVNGLLVIEETFFLKTSPDHILTRYEYEDLLVVKKHRYYNQQFDYCIIYNYSGNICVKETRYSDSLCVKMYDYTIHNYEDGVLISSDIFSADGAKKQIITYTYNEKGNLIIEESKQINPTITKILFYVIRYEYY